MVEGDPPQTVVNEDIVAALGVPATYIAEQAEEEAAEIARRRRLWLGDRAQIPARGRTVTIGLSVGAF